jgi:hypothetical protein
MIELRPLFNFLAEVEVAQVAAKSPYGTRRFIPITGGTFEGARLSGRLLSGGADCQLFRPDGVAELEVRLTSETDDGVIFLMKMLGMRHGPIAVILLKKDGEDVDPPENYFRESMIFEAPKSIYDWLNKIIGIATGERKTSQVLINALEVL